LSEFNKNYRKIRAGTIVASICGVIVLASIAYLFIVLTDLSQRYGTIADNKDYVEKRIQELNANEILLTKKINDASNKLRQINNDINSETATLQREMDKVSKITDDLKVKNNWLNIREEQIKSTKKEIQELDRDIANSKEFISKNRDLDNDIEGRKQKLDELNSIITNLKTNIESYEKAALDSKKQKNQTSADLVVENSKLTREKQNLDRVLSRVSELEGKKDILDRSVSGLRSSETSLEKQVENIRNNKVKLDGELRSEQNALTNARTDKVKEEALFEKFKSEIVILKSKVLGLESSETSLKTRVAAAKKIKLDIDAKLKTARDGLSTLKSSTDAEKVALDDLKVAISGLKVKRGILKGDVDVLENDIGKLKTLTSKLDAKVRSKRDELNGLNEKLKLTKDSLANTEADLRKKLEESEQLNTNIEED